MSTATTTTTCPHNDATCLPHFPCLTCCDDLAIPAQHPAMAENTDRHFGTGGGSGSTTTTTNGPTAKQLAMIARLLGELGSEDPQAAVAALVAAPRFDRRQASKTIDQLIAAKAKAAPTVEGYRWTKLGDEWVAIGEATGDGSTITITKANGETAEALVLGQVGSRNGAALLRVRKVTAPVVAEGPVEGLDLSPLEAMTSRGLIRLAVPGGDTRLKVRVKFHKSGTIYVDDGAVYGEGQTYGSQRPGQAYRGKLVEQLTAILADPKAAAIRYSELTGSCACCGRAIENEASVERGMGPVCWSKLG